MNIFPDEIDKYKEDKEIIELVQEENTNENNSNLSPNNNIICPI